MQGNLGLQIILTQDHLENAILKTLSLRDVQYVYVRPPFFPNAKIKELVESEWKYHIFCKGRSSVRSGVTREEYPVLKILFKGLAPTIFPNSEHHKLLCH